MGAGKTAVGRALAELLERPFVDLDEQLEVRAGMPIRAIFAERGEVGFRDLESAALRRLDQEPAMVVATGGGVLTLAENREWMRDHGTTVWLDVPFDVLLARLGQRDRDARPLFESESKARHLYVMRRGQYGDSDLRIEVLSSDSVATVAAKIHRLLLEEECDI